MVLITLKRYAVHGRFNSHDCYTKSHSHVIGSCEAMYIEEFDHICSLCCGTAPEIMVKLPASIE